MIHINLIGTDKGKRRGRGKAPGALNDVNVAELVVFSLLLAVGFAGLYFWYSYEQDKIDYAKKQVRKEQMAIKGLSRAQKRLAEFKKKKKLLKSQLKVIEDLRNSKQGPVRVLDEISMRVPKQVWLLNMRQKGNRLFIRVAAETNEAVAIFFKRLQDSPYFTKVELQDITRGIVVQKVGGESKKTGRTRFNLSCRAVFRASGS